MASGAQHPVALIRRGAHEAEIVGKVRLQPAVKRVGSEVSLHDQPSVALGFEPRQPVTEHAVQLVLTDTDRWIRPDGHESDVIGNILRGNCFNVSYGHFFSVRPHEIQCALVDVHGPHRRMR